MQFMRVSAIMQKIQLRYADWENICASRSGYQHETANNLSGFGKYKRKCGYLKHICTYILTKPLMRNPHSQL